MSTKRQRTMRDMLLKEKQSDLIVAKGFASPKLASSNPKELSKAKEGKLL